MTLANSRFPWALLSHSGEHVGS